MLSSTFILNLPVSFYSTITERFLCADWLRSMIVESFDYENDGLMSQFVVLFLSRAISKTLYWKYASKILCYFKTTNDNNFPIDHKKMTSNVENFAVTDRRHSSAACCAILVLNILMSFLWSTRI